MNSHREFFTGLAEGWDSMCTYDPSAMALFIDRLDVKPGATVLDAGCGTGVFTRELVDRFGSAISVIGLDISEGMLEKARHKLGCSSNVSFVQGDGSQRMFREQSLDRILCYSCFPHIQEKDEALRSFRQMLKHGGLLLIAHSSSRQAVNDFHAGCKGIVRHDYLPSPGEMREYMGRAGFTIQAIEDTPEHYYVQAS